MQRSCDAPASLPYDLPGIVCSSRDRPGVLGASRGGELHLLLGSACKEVKAVVSCVGSEVVDGPAWTRANNVLPYAWFGDHGSSEISDRKLRREAGKAAIPVERRSGVVLLIAAGDDSLWDSERLSRVAFARLRAPTGSTTMSSLSTPRSAAP